MMEEPLSKRVKREEHRIIQKNFFLDIDCAEFPVNKHILEEEFGLMKLRLLYIPAERNRLKIDNEDPKVVEKVLIFIEGKYIDGGNGIERCKEPRTSLDEIIEISQAGPVLDLAFRWEAPSLQEELFSYLQRSLTKDSFYTVNILVEKYSVSSLEHHCQKVLTQNFCQLCQDSCFLQLGKNKILSSLRSPDFKTNCWQAVFESLISWVEYDCSRTRCFEELFSCIELWKLSPDYLETRVESNALVMNNAACLNKVQKAYRDMYEKSEGFVTSDYFCDLKVYYPLSRRSYTIEQSSFSRQYPWINCVVLHQSHLYAFFTDCSVFRLDITKNDVAWEEIASIHCCEMKFYAAIVHGDIFVLGGDRDHIHCERYLPSKHIWERIQVPMFETQEYSIASIGEVIYIIGITEFCSEVLPSMEKLNPYDRSVTFAPPMHVAVSSPSTAVYEENIYAAGLMKRDQPYSMDIEFLDTKTGTWMSVLFAQSDGMKILGSLTMQNSVYFFGLLENVESPEKIHALSVPTTCDHLKIDALEGMEQFIFGFSTMLRPGLARYDFLIRVGNKEFPAHKKILSPVFSYFQAMFRSDMIESKTGVVELTGIDSRIVRRCIDYAYNAGCPLFTLENVESFLHLATYLQSPGLLEALAKFLCEQLGIDTFEFMKSLSNKYGCFEIEEACDNFALTNFKEVTQLPCFTTMEMEYVEFLLTFREDKDNDEIEAYESIVRWVKAGNGSRDHHFYDLFNILNLAKLPETFVIEKIPSEPLVDKSLSCMRKILQSLKKRKELQEVICLIGTDFKAFSPQFKEWKTVWSNKELPTMWLGELASCASMGKYLYGFADELEESIFEIEYHDVNADWSLLQTEMSGELLGRIVVVTANGFLFIICYGNIQRFDTIKRTWHTINVSVERESTTAVAVNEHIYVLGGVDESDEATSTVQRFDSITETIAGNLQPLLQPRHSAAAAHFDGKIFISGGCTDLGEIDVLRSVEFYDISTDSWTFLSDMNFPRSSHFACFVDGNLYVVGGEIGSEQTMEYFDEHVQDWKIEMMPDKVRRAPAVGSIPYELFFRHQNNTNLESFYHLLHGRSH